MLSLAVRHEGGSPREMAGRGSAFVGRAVLRFRVDEGIEGARGGTVFADTGVDCAEGAVGFRGMGARR